MPKGVEKAQPVLASSPVRPAWRDAGMRARRRVHDVQEVHMQRCLIHLALLMFASPACALAPEDVEDGANLREAASIDARPSTPDDQTTLDVDGPTAEARQPAVIPHGGVPKLICAAVGGADSIAAGILVSAWINSPWGRLAGVPFLVWTAAGCPVNTNLLLPVVI
jgi:hypothetical protein